MPDKLTKERRSKNMSAIRSKDMRPEIAVRRMVYGMGLRYRLHKKSLPGKPDIVFGPRKKVTFVHGCFWHQHSDPACLDGRMPKSRVDYWEAKLARNVERDKQNMQALDGLGGSTFVVWECETKDASTLRAKLREFLA